MMGLPQLVVSELSALSEVRLHTAADLILVRSVRDEDAHEVACRLLWNLLPGWVRMMTVEEHGDGQDRHLEPRVRGSRALAEVGQRLHGEGRGVILGLGAVSEE